MPRKVKATGVRRSTVDVDTESIAVALWTQSKRIARDRRLNEERARRKRRERDYE
jgi:hypothetical protein